MFMRGGYGKDRDPPFLMLGYVTQTRIPTEGWRAEWQTNVADIIADWPNLYRPRKESLTQQQYRGVVCDT